MTESAAAALVSVRARRSDFCPWTVSSARPLLTIRSLTKKTPLRPDES